MRPHEPVPAADILEIFESLGCACFLLTAERQVAGYNHIAGNYLGNELVLKGEQIAAADPASDARLQTSIAQALKARKWPSGPVSIGMRRSAKLPLVIHILRIRRHAGLATKPPDVNRAVLVLLVCDTASAQMTPMEVLEDIFSLTPTEAHIAVAIASGRRLTEIAADRGIRIETVRTHSKTVFAKTRTRGQVELAALLTRLAVQIPIADPTRTGVEVPG
jgi:DNA-binding CsgD family transcriptional regulator